MMLVTVNVDHMIVLHDYTQDRNAILTALNHHDAGAADYSGSKSRNGQGFIGLQLLAGYRSLEQVAQATAGHPGHKNVIWAGRGLPRLRLGEVSSDEALKLHVELQRLIDQLIASRVTFSTIDLSGVGNVLPLDNSVVQFAEVAIATGGTPIHNRNDMDVAIATSIRDGNDFYTLSYIPTSSSDAKGAFLQDWYRDEEPRSATPRRTYAGQPQRVVLAIAGGHQAGREPGTEVQYRYNAAQHNFGLRRHSADAGVANWTYRLVVLYGLRRTALEHVSCGLDHPHPVL